MSSAVSLCDFNRIKSGFSFGLGSTMAGIVVRGICDGLDRVAQAYGARDANSWILGAIVTCSVAVRYFNKKNIDPESGDDTSSESDTSSRSGVRPRGEIRASEGILNWDQIKGGFNHGLGMCSAQICMGLVLGHIVKVYYSTRTPVEPDDIYDRSDRPTYLV